VQVMARSEGATDSSRGGMTSENNLPATGRSVASDAIHPVSAPGLQPLRTWRSATRRSQPQPALARQLLSRRSSFREVRVPDQPRVS
jgi:hypothetical protein